MECGSMVGRSGEVVDALHRRKIDFCCAQETRWNGGSARMLGAIARVCQKIDSQAGSGVRGDLSGS